MRRVLSVLVASCALAVLQACQSDVASPGAQSSSTPTVVPTPTPTVDRATELAAAVDRAQLRPDDVGGATPQSVRPATALPCHMSSTSVATTSRAWIYQRTPVGFLMQSVAAYDPQPARAVVQEYRTALGKCEQWEMRTGDTVRMEVDGEFSIPRPDGVEDLFAYCVRGTNLGGPSAGEVSHFCEFVAGRGPLAVMIGVQDTTSVHSAQEKLTTMAPLAAASLVRAMPEL